MADKISGFNFYGVNYNFTRQDELAAKSAPEQGKSNAKENNKQVSSEVIDNTRNQVAYNNLAAMNIAKLQRYEKLINATDPASIERIEGSMNVYTEKHDSYKKAGIEEGLSDEIAETIATTAIEKEIEVL